MMKIISSIISVFSFCILSAQISDYYKGAIPFEIRDHKEVYIDIGIKNNKTKFLFDTGAGSAMLDSLVATKLNIVPNAEIQVSGAGGKKSYPLSTNETIVVGTTKIDSTNLVLENFDRLKNSLNYHFDGIIGASLLKRFKTELDFDQKKIYLYDFDEPIDLKSYKAIDFSWYFNIPVLDINIRKGDKKFIGKVLFDTGAGVSLLINSPFEQETLIATNAPKKIKKETNNLSKKSVSTEFIIDELGFGGYTFNHIPVSSSADQEGVSALKGFMGILGAEILYRFNLVIDYNKKKIYYKPNTLFYNKFDYNLTGFNLSKFKDQITVSFIDKSSPFYKKGLRENDIITSVNGKSDLDEIEKLLKIEKLKVEIVISRNGKKRIITSVLYNLL